MCKNIFCANIIIQSILVSSNIGLESWKNQGLEQKKYASWKEKILTDFNYVRVTILKILTIQLLLQKQLNSVNINTSLWTSKCICRSASFVLPVSSLAQSLSLTGIQKPSTPQLMVPKNASCTPTDLGTLEDALATYHFIVIVMAVVIQVLKQSEHLCRRTMFSCSSKIPISQESTLISG